jgi:WD40 repeat protein
MVGDKAGIVTIWNVNTGYAHRLTRCCLEILILISDSKCIQVCQHSSSPITCMALKEPATVAIGYLDGVVHILNWESDTLLHKLDAHQSGVSCMAQHGNLLISTSSKDTATKIWDITTGTLLKTLTTNSETSPWGLAWIDNYKKIVVGSTQGRIHVWNVQTG